MKNLIKKILKEEIELKENLKYSSKLIDLIIKESLIISESEEKEPDMIWDFTDVERNVKNSTSWIKTKEEALDYLKLLNQKIKNLDTNVRKRIFKIALISLIGVLGVKQTQNFGDEVINLDSGKENKTIVNNIQGKTNIKVDKTTKIRNYSDSLLNHLKYEEGSIKFKGEPVLTAYDIGDGAKTIGYGHAVFSDPDKGDNGGKYDFLPKYDRIIPGKTKITKDQAEILLIDDIEIAKEQLNKILDTWELNGIKPSISQGMYDAMISMIFNMGINQFRKSDFIQFVKNNKLDEAGEQIKNESSRMFKKFPGLKDRRENESKLFNS